MHRHAGTQTYKELMRELHCKPHKTMCTPTLAQTPSLVSASLSGLMLYSSELLTYPPLCLSLGDETFREIHRWVGGGNVRDLNRDAAWHISAHSAAGRAFSHLKNRKAKLFATALNFRAFEKVMQLSLLETMCCTVGLAVLEVFVQVVEK